MKYHVERSTLIKADMDKVQSLVKDFKHWNSWSPWTIAEPGCKMEVKGDVGQVGHEMFWDGEIIGSGKNTIESISDDRIDYDLQFLKPFKSSAKSSFIFKSKEDSVEVTWTMDSSMPFFLFFMIPMMKAWIGMDYDRGLKMLKAMVEEGKVNAKTTNAGVVDFGGFAYVGIQRTSTMEDIAKNMSPDFEKLMKDVQAKGLNPKHWISLYPKFDMKNNSMTYIAAASVEDPEEVDMGSDYVSGKIESGKMLEIKHDGSYEFLGNAWSMGMMYLRAKKMKQKPAPFEYYWNSPQDTKEDDLKTSIYFPLK